MAMPIAKRDESTEQDTTSQHSISIPDPMYILLAILGVMAILYVFYKYQLHRRATAHVRLRKKHPLPPIGHKPPSPKPFILNPPHQHPFSRLLSPEPSSPASIPLKPIKPLFLNPQTLRPDRVKVNPLDSVPLPRYDQSPSKKSKEREQPW